MGLGLGATAGFGVQGDFTFEHFTRDVPLSLRFSGAYSSRDAGHALDARRVFINNNTNGTPETSASTWQLRLDLLLPVATLGTTPLHLGLGARKAFFKGSFDYVGGNEKFDVTSSPWGAGLFVEAGFDIKPGDSPIVPVMLYNAKLSQDIARDLFDEGIYVIGFFFPVVPNGQARIRTQLSAGHDQAHLEKGLAAFAKSYCAECHREERQEGEFLAPSFTAEVLSAARSVPASGSV